MKLKVRPGGGEKEDEDNEDNAREVPGLGKRREQKRKGEGDRPQRWKRRKEAKGAKW